jgi:HNH endonuclease
MFILDLMEAAGQSRRRPRMPVLNRLLQYGVASPLAKKAEAAGLTVSTIRSTSQSVMVKKFGLETQEAAELKKCVARRPIDADDTLLSRSNHVCCVCKGQKGDGVIVHHIVEYERSQDNSYANLAILCPNDHDRAHHGGLTIGLTVEQIGKAKRSWEHQVEVANVRKAAQALDVPDEAIDYINIMRIEEMCVRRFGAVPSTDISASLSRAQILGSDLRFDEAFVRKTLSGGGYLFDYTNSRETEHYRQLLMKLSETITFEDLSEAARSGIRKLRALEGKYAFFVGGVSSKRPKYPIRESKPVVWRFKITNVEITWNGDAKYLMSSSAIFRQGNVNRYIIYGLVRTVHKPDKGPIQVTCSPLLVAQPSAYVDRTPAIAWRRHWGDDQIEDEDAESDRVAPDAGRAAAGGAPGDYAGAVTALGFRLT